MRAEATPQLEATPHTDGWLWSVAQDEFLNPDYLALAGRLGLPGGWSPVFLAVRDQVGIALLLALMVRGRRCAALTTPYSCLWAPLFRPGLTPDTAAAAALTAGRWLRRFAVTRLDALADDSPTTLLRGGLRAAGLVLGRYDHFAAWSVDLAGVSAETYLATRPGSLRSTLSRKERQLARAGLEIVVLRGDDGVQVVPDYETVAGKSWKEAEPFPALLRAWMLATCSAGTGWIGLVRRGGVPVAAQFWTLAGRRARVHKLVHDTSVDAFSPGTVLTAAMCRAMIAQGAMTLDFGRGDDGYKALWADRRVMRTGILASAIWRPAGAAAALRHATGRVVSLTRQRRAGQHDPQSR